MNEDHTIEAEEEITTDGEGIEDVVDNFPDQLVGGEHSGDLKVGQSFEDQVEELVAEIASREDKYVRLVAEFTNYRRRIAQEMSRAHQRGQADLIRGFLEVLDDLQRVSGTEAKGTSVQTLIEGIELVEKKYQQELDLVGVESIDPLGEMFDPKFMEAMVTVSTEIPEEDGTVSEVFQRGYRISDELLRAAKVSVFKAK